MTTAHVLPDAEQLIIGWALTVDALTDLVGTRIYTETPADPTFPMVRIVRFGGGPVSTNPAWLDRATMQVDVFGGRKVTARQIAATFAAHADANLVGPHDLGVVTAVAVGGLRWEPDQSYDKAKPRYVVELDVWLHPSP